MFAMEYSICAAVAQAMQTVYTVLYNGRIL